MAQIHELNTFAGSLGAGAYLAIDDGTDTGKISSQSLLAATEARIDNIIAGPAPSAEEIVDARLGADGVTYPSLGDAIRDQITDVKSALNYVDIGEYTLVQADLEQGTLNQGVPQESDTTIRMKDYIPVFKGDVIHWTSGQTGYLFFYNAAKTKIDQHQLKKAALEIITVAQDGYIRARFSLSSVNSYDSTFTVISKYYIDVLQNTKDAEKNKKDLLLFADGASGIPYGMIPVDATFELGNISLSSGSLVYSDSTTRARTPSGQSLHLPKGSIIGLTDYTDKKFVLYIDTGSGIINSDWQTTNYTLGVDADVAVVIANQTEAQLQNNPYALADYFFAIKKSALVEHIEDIDKNIGSYGLPDYWTNYLETKKATLLDNDMSIGITGKQFAFITDEHIQYNQMQSPKILKWLIDNTSVTQAISGGDIVIRNDTKAEAVELLNTWAKETKGLPCINVYGNHDNNSVSNSEHPEAKLTRDELYQLLFSYNDNLEIFKLNYTAINAYQDFPQQKIRFIYAYIGGYDALRSMFTELDSSWTIVVFTHIYWAGTPDDYYVQERGQDLLEHIVSFIPDMQATIAALICGHTHFDHSEQSGCGFPIIATTCDANTGGMPLDHTPRTAGTTAEQAIDVFYINTASDVRSIKAVRIGAGSDRDWTYTATAIPQE